MITQIIQKGELIFSFDKNAKEDLVEAKLKKIEETSTVKSVEFIFSEGVTLREASDIITGVYSEKVETVKVTLND